MSTTTEQTPKSSASRNWGMIAGLGGILTLGLLWAFYPVEHTARGASRRDFSMDVDFDKFRQILVRKNATQAIVNHAGMQLIDESIDNVDVAVPEQKRPILNAILGRAKGELSATKEITVSLKDPNLTAKQLTLTQQAEIQPDSLDVQTKSAQPAGNLTSYVSGLKAVSRDGGTQVDLSIDQTVVVRVPRVFTATADRRVQQSADQSTEDQEEAIRKLINDNKDALIVLPELKK